MKTKINNKSRALMLFLLLFISIGFAYLTTNINIFGDTLLKGQSWDIHFENVQVSPNGVQITKPIITNNRTTVEYDITLDKPGDFVEFTVDAKNDGTIDAMIKTITPITLYEDGEKIEIPDYLDYSITYEDGSEILEKHQLRHGENVTYKVHVEYKKNISKSDLLTEQKNLTAEFDVEYVQADDSAITDNKSDTTEHQTTESAISVRKFQTFAGDNDPKEVIFVNTGVSDPTNSKYADISEEQDGSILAWMDGTTLYVSAKEAGLYAKAPWISTGLIGFPYSDNWVQYVEKIDVSKLDTSEVMFMNDMFSYAGYNVDNFEITGLENWDTSNVTMMESMFICTGYNATTWTIGDIGGWDTSNVENMHAMFLNAGSNATEVEINLSGWNFLSVTTMEQMFCNTGYSSTIVKINVEGYNTGNVQNMSYMFNSVGEGATEVEINLRGFDTSGAEDMSAMFLATAAQATTFTITGLEDWNTSNVTNMNQMFGWVAQNADFSIDLSKWNVDKVTDYSEFAAGTEGKITEPNWVN